jgi:16S rRNA G966 N2-methylase RsmD
MFQEECRMKCKVVYAQKSPFDYFTDNCNLIIQKAQEKYGELNNFTLRETIYDMTNECTSFRPSNFVSIIQLLNSKCVLDFSSGWGDRLIGALACNVSYCGIDPNTCLHKGYQDMIKTFKSKKKVMMIEDGIKTAIIPKWKFDLIFTSPPYFDFEVYSKGAKQSINNNNTEQKWFDNFLKVALNKTWNLLSHSGYAVIIINHNNNKQTYIYQMINHMNSLKDSKYCGPIYYGNENSKYVQPMWIWHKK